MHIAVVVALGVSATGCIIPFATPPIKGEFGASSVVGREAQRNGTSMHAAAGAHFASGTKRENQKFDIGAGWTFEKSKDNYSNGLYGDFAYFFDRAGVMRTSIGPRGELRWLDEGGRAAAAKLRIDAEFFSGVESDFAEDGRCGAAVGTYHGTTAIGLYVEAGRLWAPEMSGGNAWVATAGISLRIPSAYGVYFGIPGC